MITKQTGWYLLLLILFASFMVNCSAGDMARNQMHNDVFLKRGSPGLAEVFAQIDSEKGRYYRIEYPPSGRRQPLTNHHNRFSTLSELADGIRDITDAAIVATDPSASTSMWIIGDAKVEPLTEAEIAKIQSLLAEIR